ncbi:MAG: transcription elongation factor GreA [Firmicutes bacterium]|nr:transcription elongation factor GreA [Bacillota bacterium]
MNEEILLTKEGYDNLVKEYEYQITERRKEVAEKLKEARSFGDLSENAEYDAAKDLQVEVEEYITKLEYQIRNAKVVETGDTENINLGNTVTIEDLATKDIFTYTIVGITDADPLNDKISNASPLGSVLIGKKIGDTVEVELPMGIASYKVLKIQ